MAISRDLRIARDKTKSPRNAGKGGIKVTKEKLAAILSEHKAWLDGKPNGIRADLSGANL